MLNKLPTSHFNCVFQQCCISNHYTNEKNAWAWQRQQCHYATIYLLKIIPFVRLGLGGWLRCQNTQWSFFFLAYQKNKTQPRKLLHWRAISCHRFKCSPTLYFHGTWNFLCRKFHSKFKKTSGRSEEWDLASGQLLKSCDNAIFCQTAECMFVNVKYLHKQLEKGSHRKSCLLPYSFLSCTGNITLFEHVVQNINSISIWERFTLSFHNKYVYFSSSHFSSHQFNSEVIRGGDLWNQLLNREGARLQLVQACNKLYVLWIFLKL